MNRKAYLSGYGGDGVVINAIYKGAGAADPTMPSDAEASLKTNAALIPAGSRTGVGVYNVQLAADAAIPRCIQIKPTVEGAALQAFITTAYVPATRQFTVSVFTAAGVAAELTAGAFLKCLVTGQDSTA